MRRIKSSILSLVLVVTLSSQLLSCGYILRPERRGQQSGKLDLAIVGLDSIGLIFFLVPGIIAFGVDIYSGTIYMQNKHASLEWQKIKNAKIDPKNINEKTIAAAIKKSSGITINFKDPRLKIYRDKNLALELARK